jgi:hypothetical protein
MLELLVNNDLEGNGLDLIEVLSRHLPGEIEENYEKRQPQ